MQYIKDYFEKSPLKAAAFSLLFLALPAYIFLKLACENLLLTVLASF